MSEYSYLYLLLMTEIFMIMHLTSYKSVCALFNCIIEQECSCPTTKSNFRDASLQQFVTLCAINMKDLLYLPNKIQGRHRFLHFSNNSAAAQNTINVLLTEKSDINKTYFLSHFKVDTTLCIIEICVHRDD